NFENATVPANLVTWDFKVDESDFAELRLAALAKNAGRTWLTAYSQPGALLSPLTDPLGFGGTLQYSLVADPDQPWNGPFATTLAGAYFYQGQINDELSEPRTGALDSCIAMVESLANDGRVVVDPCDENGACVAPGADEIDAHTLTCGGLDDIAVALTGLHPRDVTLTRLEASLPVEALVADLQ